MSVLWCNLPQCNALGGAAQSCKTLKLIVVGDKTAPGTHQKPNKKITMSFFAMHFVVAVWLNVYNQTSGILLQVASSLVANHWSELALTVKYFICC